MDTTLLFSCWCDLKMNFLSIPLQPATSQLLNESTTPCPRQMWPSLFLSETFLFLFDHTVQSLAIFGFLFTDLLVIRLSTSCLQEDPLSLTFLVQATHCSGFYLSPLVTFRTFHSKPHIPAMRPPWKLRLAPHCCSQPVLTTCLTLRDVLERILDFH